MAQHAFDQVRVVGEVVGDRRLQSTAAWNMGRVLFYQREYEAAIVVCQHGLTLASGPYNTALMLHHLGQAYVGKGDAAEAIPVLEQALQVYNQMGYRALQGLLMVRLGEAYLLRGDVEEADGLTHQGLALTREAPYRHGIGVAHSVLGQIALARGRLSEAETHFQEALDLFTTGHQHHFLGIVHLDLARLAHAQGNLKAVATYLHEAHTLFNASRLPKWVEHTAQLANELGVSR